MSVASERGKARRTSSRGRSSSNGSRNARSASGASARTKNNSSRATKSSASRARGSASKKTQSAARRTGSSSPLNHAGREVLTNAGIGALGAAIGVAGGVLLGRNAAQRGRKVLGIPVPEKIDLGGVGQQIGDAGRQFGKLANEVRTVREKAEQVGRILT